VKLYSVRAAAARLDRSPRRVQQIARRSNIGQMISGVRAFTGMDLNLLRGRHSNRVCVELNLAKGVFQKFQAIAKKREMTTEIFLSKLLNNIGEDEG
jgi:hypothetical protein